MKKLILIFMLFAISMLGQDATRKTIRNFVTAKPTSVSETGLVASYNMLLSGSQVLSDIADTNDATAFNVDYTFDHMSFDGIGSRVTGTDLILNDTCGSVLFDVNVLSASGTDFILRGVGANTNRYYFRVTTANYELVRGTNAPKVVSGVVVLNNYQNIAWCWDADSMYLYIDGSLIQTDVYTSIVGGGNSALHIGHANNVDYSNVEIRNLNVYNICLTESQIEAKFNENIDLLLYEGFSYSSLLALDRNWKTESGVYTLSGDTLTASTGGDLTTPVGLPYFASGFVTYQLYDGTWNGVAELVDSSSVFAYSSNLLTMTLATAERIRNIKITSGAEL